MNQGNLIKENGFFCTRTRNSSLSPVQHRIITIYFIDRFMVMEMDTYNYQREINRDFLSEKYENKKLFRRSLIDRNEYLPYSNIRKNVCAFDISGKVILASFYSANSDYANVEVKFHKIWSVMKGSQYVISMTWDGRNVIERSASNFHPFP
jgi:hypothetical protein